MEPEATAFTELEYEAEGKKTHTPEAFVETKTQADTADSSIMAPATNTNVVVSTAAIADEINSAPAATEEKNTKASVDFSVVGESNHVNKTKAYLTLQVAAGVTKVSVEEATAVEETKVRSSMRPKKTVSGATEVVDDKYTANANRSTSTKEGFKMTAATAEVVANGDPTQASEAAVVEHDAHEIAARDDVLAVDEEKAVNLLKVADNPTVDSSLVWWMFEVVSCYLCLSMERQQQKKISKKIFGFIFKKINFLLAQSMVQCNLESQCYIRLRH